MSATIMGVSRRREELAVEEVAQPPKFRRNGRGSLRQAVCFPVDFDELPGDIADTLGCVPGQLATATRRGCGFPWEL